MLQWDPIYLDPKDPEYSVYLMVLVSTQAWKPNHLAEKDFVTWITELASLLDKS